MNDSTPDFAVDLLNFGTPLCARPIKNKNKKKAFFVMVGLV